MPEIRLCRKASYECKDQIRHYFKQINYFVIQIRQVLWGLYIWETILIETSTKMNVNRRNCFDKLFDIYLNLVGPPPPPHIRKTDGRPGQRMINVYRK